MDAIDLTKSDSDDDVRLVKRQRTSSPDDEVELIEKPDTPAPAAAGPEVALGDEDLLITRATGPVYSHWLQIVEFVLLESVNTITSTFLEYYGICTLGSLPRGRSPSCVIVNLRLLPLFDLTDPFGAHVRLASE